MREAHPVERAVGMAYYVSDADGIGGRIREAAADFRVREIEAFDAEPLDADAGSYPHVLARVTLTGWDTNDFAAELSDRLEASRERISWAGTKDKRAITTQLFSVADADPDDLRAVEISDAEIELVGRTGRPIFFGDLAGNAFEIVVRGAEADGDRIDAVTSDLRAFAGGDDGGGDRGAAEADETATVGVPNYFGQQRFGSRRPVTHEVGLAVVRGEWRAAVRAYVGNPSEREPDSTRNARGAVDDALDAFLAVRGDGPTDDSDQTVETPATETEVWQTALDELPRRLGFERSMCHRLVERGEASDGTLDADDYRAALEAVPSNLQTLFVNAAQSYVFNRILSARLDRGLPFDEPVAGDVVCFRDADAPDGLALPDTDRTQRVTEDRLATVRRHCQRGRAFVTAPLVGTETDLSEGEPGEIEREVLDDLGLAPGDFDLPGEFHSEGTRRAILLGTDLTVEDDDGDPRFSFALPKGSYATVVLREYCKTDPDALS